MIRNRIAVVLGGLSLLVISCKKDDDVVIEPPRDMLEVSIENDEAIVSFLETHFYNYDEFANPVEGFDYQIVVDTISGDNAGKTPLIDQVQSKTIKVKNADGDEIDHKLYYLIAREGVGANPTVADSVYVNHKGSVLSTGVVFENQMNNYRPIWMDILGDWKIGSVMWTPNYEYAAGVALGYRELVVELKASSGDVVDNGDGTFEFADNYGIGAFFIPSGAFYFQGSGAVPAYAPVLFQVNLLLTKNIDHDKDGVPSICEIEYDATKGQVSFPNCNVTAYPSYADKTCTENLCD